jgi:hypothetical protein
MTEIRPPWSAETVEQLNRFQTAGRMHPFTCRAGHPEKTTSGPVLVATSDGWVCPDIDCSYVQRWAPSFMTDPRLAEPVRW